MTKVVHFKKESYDVYIGRPGMWGNPFILGRDGNREEVIAKYREWLLSDPVMVALVRRQLRGKRLGCWCAPKPCHGDVLAEIADSHETE